MAQKTMYEREKEITDKIGEKEAIEMFENLLLSENYKPVALNHCRRLAIKALKKQIPIKRLYNGINYFCPICKKPIEYENRKKKFCVECGQALDWEVNNEI